MSTLYEHGTLASLMAGNMAGTITVADLLKHGSAGIGTFDGIDGEVVILDGEVYQAVADGTVNHVTDLQAKLPFASVHTPTDLEAVNLTGVDFNLLNGSFIRQHELQNVFAALRLTGTFSHVKIRIMPKQEPPYPNLLEVAHMQALFSRDQVKGTIIGYYAPEIFGSVTAAGWHLHFISDDRQFAGHLLEFSAPQATGDLQVFDMLDQHLPVADRAFRQSEVDLASLRAGIAESEGNQE
ncbi:acetolactate decarboxylase [Limosilactobacillus antri]|uniref:acetolactate decarboxylase n=1 Tax=Limosilactobacillus antri TaxID=227943 RepID=UPI001F59E744|nr:acetolactate decarboxylase [Limosilactobacillus antri]